MLHTTKWDVDIYLFEDEDEGRTRAKAVLKMPHRADLEAEGTARRNPRDPEVPEIGEELATARALSGLAHVLIDAAVQDVEANVSRDA